MMDIKDNLKASLLGLKYGEVTTVVMIERGPYAEPEDVVEIEDTETGASKMATGIFAELAAELKTENEDLTVVKRKDEFTPMLQEDFDWFVDAMTAEKHIVFVECIELGTTEIKGFLATLRAHNLLPSSKVILLDLPTLEYMMLKDSLAGSIEL